MLDLSTRTISWIGASMGTSLAIERITHTGEFSTEEGEPLINGIDALWINLRTLIRNCHNAVETTYQPYIEGVKLAEAVYEDWLAINTALEEAAPNCELKLYLCTYEDINRDFPDANFRNSNTAKQLAYTANEKGVIKYFLDKHDEELTKFKWSLKGEKGCVLLTHLPLDLVSHDKFPSLRLLESHTGAVKERRHWFTKLNIKKDGPIIPFNKMMLTIFGDGAMFAAQPIKVRKLLLALSEKKQWHQLTSEAKMLQDIRLEHEPHLLDFVRKYK